MARFAAESPFTNPLFSKIGPFDPGRPVGAPQAAEGQPAVEPFIRFGNRIFTPEELDLGRFEPLAGVAAELQGVGIARLHQLAVADAYTLIAHLHYSRDDANRLDELAQALLRHLMQ